MSLTQHPLGRLRATSYEHITKYSLLPTTMPTTPTPVVLGINWYEAFDDPDTDRQGNRYIPSTNWGKVRGGHAICVRPPTLPDHDAWWTFYNQGQEGACVGFSISRMMTLLNNWRFSGMTLYKEAQKVDEYAGTDYEGTSVRAGCDVARKQGMWRVTNGVVTGPHLKDGIKENAWIMTVEQLAACLSPGDGGRCVLNQGYVELLNSWGRSYPHYTRLRLESARRLIFLEDGEGTLVIDRV